MASNADARPLAVSVRDVSAVLAAIYGGAGDCSASNPDIAPSEQRHLDIGAQQVAPIHGPAELGSLLNGQRQDLVHGRLKRDRLFLGHLPQNLARMVSAAPALGSRRRLRSCAQVVILDRVTSVCLSEPEDDFLRATDPCPGRPMNPRSGSSDECRKFSQRPMTARIRRFRRPAASLARRARQEPGYASAHWGIGTPTTP
jgi:hypothetical protein